MTKHPRADGRVRGWAEVFEPSDRITATIPEFRRISGIGRSRIYELLDAGELESIYIGARRLILIDSYRQLIERQRAAPKPAEPAAPAAPARNNSCVASRS
jgi:hypothetical protein